ncbi:guanine deaminase [Planctobacterium marinum]|uniref:guanine deaminase n=1 Tax=Planctobacterium marinum TaxID=1631968 RepID=UPI001E2D4C71|nr:guanine deaminase [Planctobacterium marinum]MCC2604346.1 guanine deaminase [Planctobacterium marinum]
MSIKLITGHIVHFPNSTESPQQDVVEIKQGALAIDGEKILTTDTAAQLTQRYPDAEVIDYGNKLVVPGFIDTHLHFPQTEMIASFGEQLIDWLNKYTFPTERQFEDPAYSRKIADFFLNQLWRNGTTTAAVWATVHKNSAEQLFSAAYERNMQILTGKVCMDRHCPDYLQDTPESAQQDSADLIATWHNKGRLKYAITPRFAPTSTEKQMAMMGELMSSYKDVYLQTHLSENQQEIAWVKELYPNSKHYLDVYDSYQMVTERSLFGHCIHLEDDEWRLMSEKGAIVSFCPTSNLFLGSGLYNLNKAKAFNVKTTLATDVGGGDSFSMLRTLGEAYKVFQLQNITMDSLSGLYMMTRGAADALKLPDIGDFNAGTFADFTVLDPHFNELSSLRLQDSDDAEDILFALSMLADERATVATWIAGNPVWQAQ